VKGFKAVWATFVAIDIENGNAGLLAPNSYQGAGISAAKPKPNYLFVIVRILIAVERARGFFS
jgi:hypothetical protein